MNAETRLHQRRTAIADELRTIYDASPTGILTEEQQTAEQALQTEGEAISARLLGEARLRELIGNTPGRPLDQPADRREVRVFDGAASSVPADFDGTILTAQDGSRVPVLEARHRISTFLPRSESRAAEMGLGRFLRALHQGPRDDLERRVMAESSIGSGGAMIPLPLSAMVIDALTANTVAFQAGAVSVPMTTQTLRFVRVTGYPQGTWRPENAPVTEDTPVLDNITLSAKSWALLVRVSLEMMEDSQNLDSTLGMVFSKAAALALDHAILLGAGTATEPHGIVGTAGVNVVSLGVNGAAWPGGAAGPYAPMLDAALALDTANAGRITAMVMAPRTSRTLAGAVDTLGQPLRMPARLASVPQLVTTAMPITQTQGTSSAGSSVILGDFSTVYVGMRTALQISVLSERYADTAQIGFVLWLRGDVVLAHPPAMAVIQGITG